MKVPHVRVSRPAGRAWRVDTPGTAAHEQAGAASGSAASRGGMAVSRTPLGRGVRARQACPPWHRQRGRPPPRPLCLGLTRNHGAREDQDREEGAALVDAGVKGCAAGKGRGVSCTEGRNGDARLTTAAHCYVPGAGSLGARVAGGCVGSGALTALCEAPRWWLPRPPGLAGRPPDAAPGRRSTAGGCGARPACLGDGGRAQTADGPWVGTTLDPERRRPVLCADAPPLPPRLCRRARRLLRTTTAA